ncbi:MAG: cbb3-type cytochrome c oxidase subunit I [Chitinophagaceae bacterium]
MKQPSICMRALIALIFCSAMMQPSVVLAKGQAFFSTRSEDGMTFILISFIVIAILIGIYLGFKAKELRNSIRYRKDEGEESRFKRYLKNMNSEQIEKFLNARSNTNKFGTIILFLVAMLSFSATAWGQTSAPKTAGSLIGEGGVIITLILLFIPIIGGLFLIGVKIQNQVNKFRNKQKLEEAQAFAQYLETLDPEQIKAELEKRKKGLDYQLNHSELAGQHEPEDIRGLVNNINTEAALPLVAQKKRAQKRPQIDPELTKLILWFFGCAAFWLVFGTTIGEYLGIKFVAPDVDHVSWLSFGRLRPVHTNAVFWGWSSLGMLGLSYYIVPRVGNNVLASIKLGWYSLILINASVILGSICLMAGINNGGGEYREYIWPVMLLFGIALALTLINFLKTIARRKTKEIYVANWYIVAAIIFTIIIALVAYLPFWLNGLGNTIAQGYYMHQGVGMWFMLFTLGIVYYFLPQQLNKPIYSYSLGILAFWAQILFYTLIGSHHFIFSPIPWWLQTVAIVGSMGMVIPVVAGTTNFLMTFRGAWYKLGSSYTLPFFLVGIIFYFTGSLQGTAEAFRSTNLYWHFTDFTVAHSHLTMYGIIAFFLWASIYALVPRLTGKEAPQITVGAHFWMALIGMMFYTVPLMYGSTLKGLMWVNGKPFIDGVVMMAPYWLWRAVGGSLMWISHLFFAYNLYRMIAGGNITDVNEAAVAQLNQSHTDAQIKY